MTSSTQMALVRSDSEILTFPALLWTNAKKSAIQRKENQEHRNIAPICLQLCIYNKNPSLYRFMAVHKHTPTTVGRIHFRDQARDRPRL